MEEKSKRRYKIYSAEFKVAKIEEFLKSGKSEVSFCSENNICLSTFRSWRMKAGMLSTKQSKDDELTLVDVTDKIQCAMNVVRLKDRDISFSLNGFQITVEERCLSAFLRGLTKDD